MLTTPVLISGCGSIGRRHARNLRVLGIDRIAVCDPAEENRSALSKEFQCPAYADLESALAKEHPGIVLICSPTKEHVPQALVSAQANAHLFIEKPLSHSMEGVNELRGKVEQRSLVCMVACNMRFHHGPATVKKLLDAGTIGTPRRAEIVTASYLPDWRPGQDYQKSYSADPEQGGAVLDCIHEIDLALWYLGPATLESATLVPAQSIGLSQVEGTADLVLRHGSGAASQVHLSFMEPGYRRSCVIEGTNGTIVWDIRKKRVEVLKPSGDVIESFPEPEGYDLNQMYLEEMRHFLQCVAERRIPQGNIDEAMMALEVALEAKKSGKRAHP